MARFFVLLAAVALCGAIGVLAQIKPAGSKPTLLTLEQQQDLLNQLAQLQQQTQQLLAAQQSLAAVAAAAGVSHNAQASKPTFVQPTQASANLLLSSPRPSSPAAPQPISVSKPKPISIQKPVSSANTPAPSSPPSLPPGPQINWGKCPELEPTEQEKLSKAAVITKCLETTPLPGNITRESVEQHREQIAACALRAEGWFNSAGGYDYGKAEKEIKNKRLQKDLELQVLSYHAQCKAESEEKYPSSNSSIIAQIQLYQACMDYFISDTCGIQISESEDSQ